MSAILQTARDVYRGLPVNFTSSIPTTMPDGAPLAGAELDDAIKRGVGELNDRVISIPKDTKSLGEWVKRGISDADFVEQGSGRISPEANAELMTVVRGMGPDEFFAAIDVKTLRQLNQENPKEIFGRPITRKDDGSTLTFAVKPQYGDSVIYRCGRIVSDYQVRWEVDFAQIRYGDFKRRLLDGVKQRWKSDVRLLSWHGDDSISTPANEFEALYAATNGWRKRFSSGGRMRSWGAQNPTPAMFVAMIESLPTAAFDFEDEFAFVGPRALKSMYALELGYRSDQVAGRALQGLVPDPAGIPFKFFNAMPRSENLTVTGAVPATFTFPRSGPYTLTAAAKKMVFKIGTAAKPNKTIDFSSLIRVSGNTAGPVTAAAMASLINSTFAADTVNYGAAYSKIARDDDLGRLVLTSPTTGGTSIITFADDANDCYAELGLTAAQIAALPLTVTGNDTSGVLPRGMSTMLGVPKHFSMGIIDVGAEDGMRIGSDYELSTDYTRVALRAALAFEHKHLDYATLFTDIMALPPGA